MAGRRGLEPKLERWAEALAVDLKHGEGASDFIADRITLLAQVGDEEGVARWLEIAALCDRLRSGTVQ